MLQQHLLGCAIVVLVLSSLWLVPGGWAQPKFEDMAVVTGAATGTYFRFGHDLAEVARQAGLQIVVKESKGSLDNIRLLVSKENATLGIVQSDVLGFLSRSNDPTMRRIASKLRLITPFYNEEVHLFTRTEIQHIENLRGKRVVLGLRGSGTWLTATNLLNVLNITPAERLELPPPEAVHAVLTGKADAMFYVAGKPTPLFVNLANVGNEPRYAEMMKHVHFVPIQNPKTLREYLPSSLNAQDYAWWGKAVETVAVKSMLISFNFAGKSPYHQHRCGQLALLGKVVREQLASLQSRGHPKWKEVRLDEQDAGIWRRDACSQGGTQRALEDDILKCLKGSC